MAVVFEGVGKPRVHRGPCLSLDLPPSERGAGWEREIAPSVLKEVEVCPTFLSDDAHTIGLPPRTTQPSVGRYVREVKHYRDASYGSHFGLYGGVNLLPVFGERMKTVPTVPRTHHHFGTGVNAGFEEAQALHPSVLELSVIANRANWIPTPAEASANVVKLAKPTVRYPQERQALFPFPRDPAGTSCPRPAPAHPPPAPQQEEEVVLPKSSLMWPTPFWYNGSLRRPGRPVGHPDDYEYSRLRRDCRAPSVRRDLEVDEPEYYIPGQIGDSSKCAQPEPAKQEDLPVVRVKRPLYERRIIPFRPPHEHYQLDPWLGQDKENLGRAGLAFRSGICSSHYSRYPPGPQPAIPVRRCDYPDIKLSVL